MGSSKFHTVRATGIFAVYCVLVIETVPVYVPGGLLAAPRGTEMSIQ